MEKETTPITLPRAVVQQVRDALAQATPKPCEGDDDYAERGFADHKAAIAALDEALAQRSAEPAKPKDDLRDLLAVINERDPGRWEIGFRNIVNIMVGPRQKFEIVDVVEDVRTLVELARMADARASEYADRIATLTEAARLGLEALSVATTPLNRDRQIVLRAIAALSAALPAHQKEGGQHG